MNQVGRERRRGSGAADGEKAQRGASGGHGRAKAKRGPCREDAKQEAKAFAGVREYTVLAENGSLYRFQGSWAKARKPDCTLTTAQRRRFRKGQITDSGKAKREAETGRRKGSAERRHISKVSWSQEKRRKNQANKSTGWMPWRQPPMKDAASCEKLRGTASKY